MEKYDIDRLEGELKAKFQNCEDFIVRKITLNSAVGLVCSIKEMADKSYIAEKIIRPLILKNDFKDFTGDFESVLQVTALKETAVTDSQSIDEICLALCGGNALAALYNGELYAAVCPADAYFGRSADKPETDITVRGPQVSFVEDMDKNISSIRKIVRSPALKNEEFKKGTVTHTKISLLYIEAGQSPR